MKTRRLIYSLLFILPAVSFTSCSLWQDFTTYFNLYYNTSELFEQAESSIFEQKRALFSTEELTIPGNANQQLVKVIEKCSRLLQFHSNSSYVDNALLMIGKSFYYQKNYQKALRKFQELIVTQPESGLILDTQLWIGKTQMRLRDYEQGLQTLIDVRTEAFTEDEDEIVAVTFIEEIIYRISRSEYNSAITLTEEFVSVSRSKERNAELMYELGKLYLKVNDYDNAVKAFEDVFRYSPSYDVEFESRIELAKALRERGDKEQALDLFRTLRREDKNRDLFDIIDLEIGTTLTELGNYESAVEVFAAVDTTYRTKQTSGVAKYKLGEIFQYHYHNYDSAATYYLDASRGANLPEYTVRAIQKGQLFNKYRHLSSQIREFNKQLFYLDNPEEFTKDSLLFVQDSIALANEFFWQQIQTDPFFMQGEDEIESKLVPIDSLKLDSLYQAGTNIDSLLLEGYKLDSLWITEFNIDSLLQLGFSIDSLLIAERKVIPGKGDDFFGDERRRGGFEDKKENEQPLVSTQQSAFDSLLQKLSKPKLPILSADSIRVILARNQLELGNLFLTELEYPDSAYHYYYWNIERFPGSPYEASTLYSLGSYYLTINENKKADSLFNYIYDNYKNESIVNAAADKLGKPFIDLDFDPVKELYVEAESLMMQKNYSEAINGFYNLYREFPQSQWASKAVYAAGWLLENELKLLDSAVVFYDTLLIKYPATQYASKIRPKLNFYKQEKERERQMIQDSLHALQKQMEDSLATDSLHILESLEDTGDETIKPLEEDIEEEFIEQEKIDEESGEESESEEEGYDFGALQQNDGLRRVHSNLYIPVIVGNSFG